MVRGPLVGNHWSRPLTLISSITSNQHFLGCLGSVTSQTKLARHFHLTYFLDRCSMWPNQLWWLSWSLSAMSQTQRLPWMNVLNLRSDCFTPHIHFSFVISLTSNYALIVFVSHVYQSLEPGQYLASRHLAQAQLLSNHRHCDQCLQTRAPHIQDTWTF